MRCVTSVIMHVLASTVYKGFDSVSMTASGALVSKRRQAKKKWWHQLFDSADPITLEPLHSMKYPPFELESNDGYSTYFDGRVLANYLVKTGVFVHPTNRRNLTLEDCVRLEEYLCEHKLGTLRVVYAFEHKHEYKNRMSPGERLHVLQQEAAELSSDKYGIGLTSERVARLSYIRTEIARLHRNSGDVSPALRDEVGRPHRQDSDVPRSRQFISGCPQEQFPVSGNLGAAGDRGGRGQCEGRAQRSPPHPAATVTDTRGRGADDSILARRDKVPPVRSRSATNLRIDDGATALLSSNAAVRSDHFSAPSTRRDGSSHRPKFTTAQPKVLSVHPDEDSGTDLDRRVRFGNNRNIPLAARSSESSSTTTENDRMFYRSPFSKDRHTTTLSPYFHPHDGNDRDTNDRMVKGKGRRKAARLSDVWGDNHAFFLCAKPQSGVLPPFRVAMISASVSSGMEVVVSIGLCACGIVFALLLVALPRGWQHRQIAGCQWMQRKISPLTGLDAIVAK